MCDGKMHIASFRFSLARLLRETDEMFEHGFLIPEYAPADAISTRKQPRLLPSQKRTISLANTNFAEGNPIKGNWIFLHFEPSFQIGTVRENMGKIETGSGLK